MLTAAESAELLAGQAVHHRSSPQAGKIAAAPHDFPLSKLPCQGASQQGSPFRHAAASPQLWREQHPQGHEQTALNFSAMAGGSQS